MSANIRWKKVYLRQPVGPSQLRKTDTRKLLPLHERFAACMTAENAVCGTIRNFGVSWLFCVIRAGWKELPYMTRLEPCEIVHLQATK